MRSLARLLFVLVLLAGAGVAMRLAPPMEEVDAALVLGAVPWSLGGWTGSDGAPESVLPVDPRERSSIRRTYRQGSGVAWVSVALFSRQDDPARRPSLSLLYPERNTSLVERVALTVGLNASPHSAVSLPTLLIRRGGERLVVTYWHQIGHRPYGNPYLYRAALLRETLLARRADAALVRIAVSLPRGESVEAALEPVTQLAPPLHAAVSRGFER